MKSSKTSLQENTHLLTFSPGKFIIYTRHEVCFTLIVVYANAYHISNTISRTMLSCRNWLSQTHKLYETKWTKYAHWIVIHSFVDLFTCLPQHSLAFVLLLHGAFSWTSLLSQLVSTQLITWIYLCSCLMHLSFKIKKKLETLNSSHYHYTCLQIYNN